jgi:hypothetical protein
MPNILFRVIGLEHFATIIAHTTMNIPSTIQHIYAEFSHDGTT